ncbi:MAG: ribbon-helix-helix domain-containing protein [Pseudomonadota bacterium]
MGQGEAPERRTRAATRLEKRSLTLNGHATSVALEPLFWQVLEAWAAERDLSTAALIAEIDAERIEGPLASALRVALLSYVMGPPARRPD